MRYPRLPSPHDDWHWLHKYLRLYEPAPAAKHLFQMYESRTNLFFESNHDKIIFSTTSDGIIAGTIVAYLICRSATSWNSNLTYRLTIARPGGFIESESGMLQLLQSIQSSYGHHGSTVFKHENSPNNPIIVTIVCKPFLTQVRRVCCHVGVEYKLDVRLSTKWTMDFMKRAYGISYDQDLLES